MHQNQEQELKHLLDNESPEIKKIVTRWENAPPEKRSKYVKMYNEQLKKEQGQ
jgi:hypothetical protein